MGGAEIGTVLNHLSCISIDARDHPQDHVIEGETHLCKLSSNLHMYVLVDRHSPPHVKPIANIFLTTMTLK